MKDKIDIQKIAEDYDKGTVDHFSRLYLLAFARHLSQNYELVEKKDTKWHIDAKPCCHWNGCQCVCHEKPTDQAGEWKECGGYMIGCGNQHRYCNGCFKKCPDCPDEEVKGCPMQGRMSQCSSTVECIHKSTQPVTRVTKVIES